MDKMDIAQVLVSRGVDQDAANQLKGSIRGDDLMNLIDALNDNLHPATSDATASRILGKYGIKLGSNKNMTKRDDYLNAKFESLRTGQALDETCGVMTRVSEGFSYAVEVSEQTRDRVLDWLDENAVEYQATSPVSYKIECGDRDMAYRAGRAISEILRKPTVRDSIETVEEKMSKNPDKRVRDAKAKMADMKPRNPVVKAMASTGKSGSVHTDKDARKDAGRKAKYKPRFDEEIDFAIGEDVMVGEVAGQVKIPHGPNGTIGVIMNGQLEMVSENEVSRLDEGVMGMKPVNPLFRLRELAGLPLRNEDDLDGIEIADAPEIDPQGILSAGPVGADEPQDMDVDGMGADPVADPMPDMDGGMDDMDDLDGIDVSMPTPGTGPEDSMPDTDIDVSGMDDIDSGMPGSLGSDPIEAPMGGMPGAAPMGMPGAAPMAPTQSDAMSAIEDALNSIQTGLADIRLSEYKSLVQKLQDLTNQAQMMGRDYLGEGRRKK